MLIFFASKYSEVAQVMEPENCDTKLEFCMDTR